MKIAYLNGTEITDMAALHSALASQLDFPDHYGANLDALYDVLTEAAEPQCVVIDDAPLLSAALGDYYAKLIRVLEDVSAERGNFSFVISKDTEDEDDRPHDFDTIWVEE